MASANNNVRKYGAVSTVWQWVHREILSRRFIRDVGILTGANFFNAVLSFIQGILVARWLGPELYGVAALVMSYPGLVYAFFDARSAEASVKYLSEFHARGERDRILAMCKLGYMVDLAIALLAFFVVLFTAHWAACRIVHRPETAALIILYSAAFLPRVFTGTSYAVLATLGRFPTVAWLDTVSTLLRVVTVIVLVLLGWQVSGVIWGNAIALAVTGISYGAVAYTLIRRVWGASWLRGSSGALKGRRREIFGFLLYNNLNALLGMIPKQLDVVLLGYFRNPTEIGYYKLAKSLSGAVGYIVGPLQSVTYPELARLWGLGDTRALRQKVRRLALQVGTPLGFAVLGVIPLTPILLSLLVGRAYLPAAGATQIFLIGSASWLVLFWLRPLFLASNKVDLLTMSNVIALFLMVPILPLSVHLGGYIGVSVWSIILGFLNFGILITINAAKNKRRRQ